MQGLLQLLPAYLFMVAGSAFLLLAERVRPGRVLPPSKNWYLRALIVITLDLAILAGVGWLYDDFFRTHALFSIRGWDSIPLEVAFVFLVWTFVFYWWHRANHLDGLWHFFHQMHHSPSRIEAVTAFYKSPYETISEGTITACIVYLVFGASAEVGAWLGALVTLIGFFSHANIRTPKWIGWFTQRPEQHSIHHKVDLHKYNYADFILWDRIFGTFREADDFVPVCGFPGDGEQRVGEMLRCHDVYVAGTRPAPK